MMSMYAILSLFTLYAYCIVVTPQLGCVHWCTKCAEQINFHIWGTLTKFPYKHIPLAVKLAALMLNVPIITEIFCDKVKNAPDRQSVSLFMGNSIPFRWNLGTA